MKIQSAHGLRLSSAPFTRPCTDPMKLLESIVDVICTFDSNGVFQYVSKASFELFGYAPEEMTGLPFTNFIVPEDFNKTARILSERTPGCQTSNFENRYYRKDGSTIDLLWSGRWDENDQLMYCVARNGTEKREMEQLLVKAQHMARVAHFEYDAKQKAFIHISDMFYSICGLDKKRYAVIDTTFFHTLIHPDDKERVLKVFFRNDGRHDTITEYRIIRPDGELVFLCHQRELIYDTTGQHIKSICIIQDITNRKITELAIQQSEHRFKSLVQNGMDIIGIIDIEGNYRYVGENVEQLLGYTTDEITGKNAFSFIHPEDQACVTDLLQEVMNGKEVDIPPFRFKNSRHEWRWMETHVSNYLADNVINGLVINSRDITEKKQKDDELKLLSQITQESQNTIIVTDHNNIITWANNAFIELSEYSWNEIIGKRPEELFISEDMDLDTHLAYQKKLQEGEKVQKEVRFYSKSRKRYWIDLQIQPLYSHDKEMLHFIGKGKDITERKKAESLLLLSEQRFKSLVQNGSDLIVILDKTHDITYISDNVKGILGYDQEDIVGKCVFDFIHPQDKEKVMLAIGQIGDTDKNALGVHHRFLHNDGQWLWLESKGTNHTDDYAIQGILINSRNISDRKELQEKLKQETINKQKEITAAVIKAQESERSQLGLELHDNVNQILTTVKLYNELYLTGAVESKEILHKSSKFLQDCIDEIRSISKRLSAPTLGEITLQDSIKDLVDSINVSNDFELAYLYDKCDDVTISEDLHLAIYRIVQESLNNIIKYSEAKSASIELRILCGKLSIKVADDGKGFDTTAKRNGIGITNMKTRAENLNGTFQLTSAPGQGCTIEICFNHI